MSELYHNAFLRSLDIGFAFALVITYFTREIIYVFLFFLAEIYQKTLEVTT